MKGLSRVRLAFTLFGTFFLIGLFTFGGGFSMIPLIARAVVERRKWLTEEEFREDLAFAVPIPGPNAVNIAFLVGFRVAGALGAALAALGCVLPSFLVILGIALGLSPYFATPLARKFFSGAGAAAVGLIAYAFFRIGRGSFREPKTILLGIAALALLISGFHPLLALLFAVLGGLIYDWARSHPR
ncbi:chromate transporter [Candidatus Bipolaricaulota bacterium]|nr:chromate transporter [Candidatus Bipolaricaulota bacterium]